MFIQGMTDSEELQKFLTLKFPQGEVQETYDRRLDEVKTVSKQDSKTPLRAFWKMVDRSFDQKSEPLQCQEGCGHCCYTAVAATQLEWDGILNNARENDIDLNQVIERSTRTISKVRKVLDQGKDLEQVDWHRLVINQPCPFLNDDQSCMVYEDRPLDCRMVVAYRDACTSKNLEHAQRAVVVDEAVGPTVIARLQHEQTPKIKRRKFTGSQKVRLLHHWLILWQEKNKKKKRR